ncbi:flavin-containing monooxygenase [Fibrella forsythiae]|uniref:NAD(P)/FAD-dependent oxidoreductase n=1 Tax=Fibrella forsythiae TaxID=2817061 RepID=A0ABS3JHP3_9BACT|nr:NAD(P)/FAD-dependent oxidoreductase [Fibrella forsythiae]MBO0949518.1 NAD(P)/FAD-dependent oxidoreductase [Fibrella forsythiae]
MTISTTIIIGAGPAGLAVAGRLAKLGQPFMLLEATDSVGAAWRQHYDRLCLHTVKEESALPHLPYPAHYPTYVSRNQLVTYLEQYIAHFGIKPLYNQYVLLLERTQNGHWQVTTKTHTFASDKVVVCTGYNRVPYRPDIPGLEGFRGLVVHSRDYKTGAMFRGQRALVVGMGNTGAELALDLQEQGAFPTISVRGPVNIVKRDTFGRPAQPSAIKLSKMPNWFYDFAARLSQRLTVGDLSRYGLITPPYPSSYQIRVLGKIPVIDLGTVDQIKAGTIAVRPGIKQVNPNSVIFTDGREDPFDAIILATGYRTGLAELLAPEISRKILNEKGYPRGLWDTSPALKGLYFLGFALPLTGILRGIRLDSERIVEELTKS